MKTMLLSALMVCATSTLARGVEVTGTAFELGLTVNGETTYTATTSIPLLPGEACYYWYIQLSKAKGDIAFTEVMTLPAPPADWGDAATIEGITISEDGMSVTREGSMVPTEGWISNGWCIVEGDPTGPHLIEVRIGEELVGSFGFEVVAPEGDTPEGEDEPPQVIEPPDQPAPPSKNKPLPPSN